MPFIFLFLWSFQIQCWIRSVKFYTTFLKFPLDEERTLNVIERLMYVPFTRGLNITAKHFFKSFMFKNKFSPKFFSFSIWFSFTDTSDSCERRGKEAPSLFTTSTRSRAFRPLFATLHLRWLPRIFNHSACNYQMNTRWDFSTCGN